MKCSIMLHFIWVFTVCQITRLRFPSIQRVKIVSICSTVTLKIGSRSPKPYHLFSMGKCKTCHFFLSAKSALPYCVKYMQTITVSAPKAICTLHFIKDQFIQGIFCPSLGAEFRPHSRSKIATFFFPI